MSDSPETLNSVETIQAEVDDLQSKLETLKQELEAEDAETMSDELREEKEAELEALQQEIDEIKVKIQAEIELLRDQTTEEAEAERETYESMLSALEDSNTELNTLKDIVVKDSSTENDNRFQRQWESITSKDERKKNTWMNVARVAGGVGAVVLVWRGLKRLFGKKKKTEEEANTDNPVGNKVADKVAEKTGNIVDKIMENL